MGIRLKLDRNFIILFIIVFFSQDTLLFGTNANENYFWFKNIILVLLLIFLLYRLIIVNSQIKNEGIVILIFLSILSLISMGINEVLSIKYFYEILMLTIALLLVELMTFGEFKKKYIKVMYFLAIYSLITTVIYYILYPLIEAFPSFSNTVYTFHNLLFASVMEKTPYIHYRNFGIFREPGIYVILLVFALLFAIDDKQVKIKYVLIFSAAIITTFSTAGYFLFVLVLLKFLICSKSTIKYFNIKLFCTVMLLIFLLTIINDDKLYSMVFGKLYSDNASIDARIGSLFVNMKIFTLNIKNVLLGSGYVFAENNFAYIAHSLGFYMNSNTNMLLKVLAVHGIFYAIICYVGIFKFCYKYSSGIFSLIMTLLIIILALSNEDLIFNTLVYIFIFYGYVHQGHSYEDIGN